MLSAYYIVDKYHSIVDVVINTVHLFLSFVFYCKSRKQKKTAQFCNFFINSFSPFTK